MAADTNGLTPKQRRPSLNAFMAKRLTALRELGDGLGMFPRSHGDAERNREMFGEIVLFEAVLTVLADNRTAWQKAACATILDMCSLTWRSAVGPEVLGYIVDRDAPEVRRWRAAVLKRDGHACQICDARGNLHAHHIAHWATTPEMRLVVDNGVTLCPECHVAEHSGKSRLN